MEGSETGGAWGRKMEVSGDGAGRREDGGERDGRRMDGAGERMSGDRAGEGRWRGARRRCMGGGRDGR